MCGQRNNKLKGEWKYENRNGNKRRKNNDSG